jgi:hypothetical protein
MVRPPGFTSGICLNLFWLSSSGIWCKNPRKYAGYMGYWTPETYGLWSIAILWVLIENKDGGPAEGMA